MRRKPLITIAIALMLAGACWAQRDRGALTGIVTDSSGAVLPNVQLVITNTDTNAVYKAASTDAGAYTVPNLPIGPYKMEFEAAGFKKLQRGNIQLSQGQVLRVDVTMEVGAVTDSIQVTAELSRVETDTPRVATTMGNSQVRDLPITFTGPDRARTVEDWVYKIVPGIAGSTWSSSINGLNIWGTKETLFDGTPAGGNVSGTITESSISIEAVAETQVLTSGYSAEYGRLSNGVFTYTLKSGANEIHGSVYGALRNEALNANSWTNNFFGRKRSLDRKQNFAFSFGGPIYIPKVYNGKNKTFFYATYERYRQHIFGAGAPNANYPVPEFYQGDFSRLLTGQVRGTDALGRDIVQGAIYDPLTIRQLPGGRWIGDMFPGNRIPVSRFSKVTQTVNKIGMEHYLPTYKDPATGLYPLQQNANFPGTTQISAFDQHQFSLKLDHNVSDKHKLSGSTDYNQRPVHEPRGGMWDWSDPKGGVWANYFFQPLHTWRFRMSEDWTITPRVFNRIQGNYNRFANPMTDAKEGTDGAAAYGIPGLKLTNYPAINWGGGPIYGLSNPASQFRAFNSGTVWGYQDILSFSKGRHFMKAGYENRNEFFCQTNSPGSSFNFSSATTTIPQEQVIGSYTGYAFASYLLGMVNSASLSIPAPRTRHSIYHAFFFQDDFKVRPDLTLNLGLRWDYSPAGFESHDRQASWNPAKSDPLVNLPGAYDFAGKCTGCTGSRTFGIRDFNNFGPRIGFAWQARKGLTVRGAYTITYIGDDTGTAGPDGSSSAGGIGPDIVGNGTNNLSADPVYPWKALFNWDDGLPQNIFVPPVRNVSYADTIGGATMVDPRYGTAPYIQQWNFNIQKQLPGKILVDAGYIGNKSTKLRTNALTRLNQTPVSVIQKYGTNLPRTINNAADAANYRVPYPYPGFVGTVNSALRQFPQLRGNNTVTTINAPEGMASYNSFNLIVNRQLSQGLSIYASWVWSKTIDNLGGGLMDYYNRRLDKLINGSDIPHRIKIFAQYDLPVGRGKAFGGAMPRALNAVLGGWTLVGIANYSSGGPLGFSGASGINGWNGGGNRVNVAPGQLKLANLDSSAYDYANRLSNPAGNRFFDTSRVSAPPPLTLGSAALRFTTIRNWGSLNEDLGLQKNFHVREKYRGQIRAEFLNALNRHSMPGPNTNVTSPNFGYMTGNPGGNRVVQVGARLDF